MLLKTYNILVSFGDGKPVESTIEARDGILAQDLALAKFPGARSIRIQGVVSTRSIAPKTKPKKRWVARPEPKPEPVITIEDLVTDPDLKVAHPLFDEACFSTSLKQSTDIKLPQSQPRPELTREEKVEKFLELYQSGLSLTRIAGQLDIGTTTAQRWRKAYVS